ncbi:MAG: RiPP maturation radical SAM C-methyltransferase [Acidobacteriota bacterium]
MTRPRLATDVLLVSMPFGPLHQPSLGLALLQAGLARDPRFAKVGCRILYLTFGFAERLGADVYTRIAEGDVLACTLEGEWLFARGLAPRTDDDDRRYLDDVFLKRWSPGDAETIWRARDLVLPYLDACVESVLAQRPRIVGFTSVFQQQLASLGLARRLKDAAPEIAIVFGGANCEGDMGREVVRRFPFVDAAVSGEGDRIFPEIAARLLSGERLAGLPGVRSQSENGAPGHDDAPRVMDMDALPLVDHADFFRQHKASNAMKGKKARLVMETSRGCWWGEKHHCTFCGLNGASMTFRSKSPARVLEELAAIPRRTTEVLMTDNIMDARYVRTLLPELARRRLSTSLFYEIKSNLTRDQVELLARSGIREIQPGIESLSDTVLDIMKKGVRGLQNVALLKWCLDAGITPYWNFLWGFPGEPAGEYDRLAGLVPLLHHLPPPEVGVPIRLDRFSPNYSQAASFGLAGVRPLPAYRHVYPCDVDDGALARLAYFFAFDYADGRDVGRYTARLAAAIDEWKVRHAESRLVALDREDELVVLDSRVIARRKVTRLRGLHRLVLLACDAVQTRGSLRASVADETDACDDGQLAGVIAELCELRLLVEDGSRRLLALTSAARA